MSRRDRPLLGLVALQAVAIVALVALAGWLGRDELSLATHRPESELKAPSRVESAEGMPLVKLTPAAQKASGIEVAALAPHRFDPGTTWYGTVVAMQGLDELRARWLAAEREIDVVRPAVARSEAEYRRVQALYRDDRNASQRALQAAEADWQADRARLAAAEDRRDSAHRAIETQWGETIAHHCASHESHACRRLLLGEDALVRVALEGTNASADAPAELEIATIDSAAPHRARLLSAAPQGDAAGIGRTYFYLVHAPDLRAGMRVAAHAALQGSGRTGVVVPGRALLWHAGKSWVYLEAKGGGFARREVLVHDSVGDGWFVEKGLAPGERVVVSGPQLLLSEEYRYQIKNENSD